MFQVQYGVYECHQNIIAISIVLKIRKLGLYEMLNDYGDEYEILLKMMWVMKNQDSDLVRMVIMFRAVYHGENFLNDGIKYIIIHIQEVRIVRIFLTLGQDYEWIYCYLLLEDGDEISWSLRKVI
jgi:hypothetical protein